MTRLYLPKDEILKILRMNPFLGQEPEEQKSYLFQISPEGMVWVSAASGTPNTQMATAQYVFQVPTPDLYEPGAFLYPHNELARLARYNWLNISLEQIDGMISLQTRFVDERGIPGGSVVGAPNPDRFVGLMPPAQDQKIAQFTVNGVTLTRAIARTVSIAREGGDINTPTSHVYLHPEYPEFRMVASNKTTIGYSLVAVHDGDPIEMLVRPEVLLRSVKLLFAEKQSQVVIAAYADGVRMISIGRYGVVFREALAAPYLIGGGQGYMDAYFSAAPPEVDSTMTAEIQRNPLSDIIESNFRSALMQGHTDLPIDLEFSPGRMRIFWTGGNEIPLYDMEIRYQGNPLRFPVLMGDLSRLLINAHSHHLLVRVSGNAPCMEIMDLPVVGRPPEFRTLIQIYAA